MQGTVDELLEKARLAMRERRYTEPNGDNALLYYRSAADADAGERRGSRRSDARRRRCSASRFDEARRGRPLRRSRSGARALESRHARDDQRVARLDAKLATAQVSKMLADGNLDRAAALVRKGAQQSGAVPDEQITKWRNEINRRQDEVKQKRLVDLAQERIRDGRLVEPATTARSTTSTQLKELPGTNAAQQRVTRELGRRVHAQGA